MGAPQSTAFAALLRRFRRETGMTQAELAEKAGLSTEAVSALERGINRTPRRETVDLLSEALNLDEHNRVQFEQAARRRVSLASSTPEPASERPAALVGRAQELSLIERLLSGHSAPVLLFSGEPGVGKTRLLREATVHAVDSGWTVLSGSLLQASAHDPYAPLIGMLEHDIATRAPKDLKAALQGCGWLVRLLPELAEHEALQLPTWSLAPEQERRLMFAAIARYLSNIGGSTGVLLVLDDIQWAGSDACDLLTALARNPAPTRLRIVGGYRAFELPPEEPLAAALADLEHEGLLHQWILDSLTSDESAALLRELLPDDTGVSAGVQSHVLQQCSGIPFYLVSWAQALASGTQPIGEGDALPWDVMQSIRRRIASQPESAVSVMQVLAVAGGKATLRLLRDVMHVAGHGEDDVIAALEASTRARLLDEAEDDSYEFAHEVIREVVMRDLSAARRNTLHRRIAEALEQEPGEPPAEMLAFHYLRADEPVKAVAYLESAGDRAVAMRAFGAAEQSYADLVTVLDRLGRPREAALAREKWGGVLRALSRYDLSLAALERAYDVYRDDNDAEAQMRLVTQLGQVHADRGTAREGMQRLAPALAKDGAGEVTPQTLAALHDVYAQLLHVAGQYHDQMTETERAAAYARDADDALLLCQIQMRRGNAQRMLGHLREASQTLEEVIHTAETVGDPRIISQALENVSVVYLLQGEFDRSTRYVERALLLVEQLADPLATELLVLRRGLNAYAFGNWQQARQDYTQAYAISQQVGTSWVSAYIALGSGQLRLAEGDIASGSALLEEAATLAEREGDLQALRWAQAELAERDLLMGEPAAARARLTPLLDSPGQEAALVTYLMPYLAWASLELGDADVADDYLRECLKRATKEHIRLAEVEALRVRVIQATQQSDFDGAEQALEDGLRVSRELPYPYAEAKLLYSGGLCAHAQGDDARAGERLRTSQQLLTSLGEGLYLPHVRKALASLT